MAKAEPEGYELIHATPDLFFEALDTENFPIVDRSLYASMVGCYTSMLEIKQVHKRLEGALLSAEKMSAAACLEEGVPYPAQELDAAFESLAFLQFHDSLPGTMTETVKQSMMTKAGLELELGERVRRRAFFALARRQPSAKAHEIPILVYNHHPYPVTETIVCEYMLQNQNWDRDAVTLATLTQNGMEIPAQLEKEESHIPLDWRKRVVFRARLAPMSMNRFNCHLRVESKSDWLSAKSHPLKFTNADTTIVVDGETGLINEWLYKGQAVSGEGFGKITVFSDDMDPWHMRGDFINEIKGYLPF